MAELSLIFVAVCVIIGVCLYFFSIAFVRKKGIDVENFESIVKKALEPHKDKIKQGIDYINSLDYRECKIQSFDGLSLSGRYFEAKNSRGTAILFHGYRSAAIRDFSCAVKMYMDLGLSVLLVDQRSHGKSEGRLITFGAKERFDVLSWVDFIIRQKGAEEQIILGGMSMGATTVLLSAGLGLPANVKGIIADSGFTSPIDIIKKVARDSYNLNASAIIPIFNLLCIIFGKFSLYGVSTEDAVKKSRVPIFFIHGLADNFVPSEMCKRNYEGAVCEKDILLVEGAGHGLGYFFDKRGIEEKAEDFIKRNIT